MSYYIWIDELDELIITGKEDMSVAKLILL